MRTHVVMVPGFGGFDALGQLHYYAGVSQVFKDWRRAHPDVVLHYFDNLPTAAVATRARDLEEFLVKLVGRSDVQRGDEIVLVGHSTGGLDIRHLLRELKNRSTDKARVRPDATFKTDDKDKDKADDGDAYVRLEQAIKRVVFLSVPHCGTNIADFVAANSLAVKALLRMLRYTPSLVGVGLSIVKRFHLFGESDLIDEAIDDVRRELRVPKHPWHAAEARRAESELRLWRKHAASDFVAIDDLASARAGGTRLVDTAAADTAHELEGIDCLTFATVAPNPYLPTIVHGGELRSAGAVAEMSRAHVTSTAETDQLFRISYGACSAGPFARNAPVTPWFPKCAPSPAAQPRAITNWDNDGIVNTASMLWPTKRNEMWLVHGDHADIIGHYSLRETAVLAERDADRDERKRRHYDAYDLLDSASTFGPDQFVAVWTRVLDFAAGLVVAHVGDRHDEHRDPPPQPG